MRKARIRIALLGVLVCASVSAIATRGDAPAPAALWKALVPRAGRVVLSAVPRAEGDPPLPPEAVRADITPGVLAAGLESDGTWLADRLASASTDAVEIRFRLVSTRPVEIMVSTGGGEEFIRRLVPGVESAATVAWPTPLDSIVLRASATEPCVVDILAVEPRNASPAPPGEITGRWSRYAHGLERELRQARAEGVGCPALETSLADALADAPVGGSERELENVVRPAAAQAERIRDVRALMEWQRRVTARVALLERFVGPGHPWSAELDKCQHLVDRARETIASGGALESGPLVEAARKGLQGVAAAVSVAEAGTGATARPTARGGLLEDANGSPWVPSEVEIPLDSGVEWSTVRPLLLASNDVARVRVDAPADPAAIESILADRAERLPRLARDIGPYGVRVVPDIRLIRNPREPAPGQPLWWGTLGFARSFCASLAGRLSDQPNVPGLRVVLPLPEWVDVHCGGVLPTSWTAWLTAEYGNQTAVGEAWFGHGDPTPTHELDRLESLAKVTVRFPAEGSEDDARYSDLRLWWETESHRIQADVTAEVLSRAPDMLVRADWARVEPNWGDYYGQPPLAPEPPIPSRALSFRSGIRAVDRGWVNPGSTEGQALRVLRDAAGGTRPRVAVVASLRGLGRGGALAARIGSVLTSLGVDADLVPDSAVREDPLLPGRYKALIYDTSSLDPKSLARINASGVPTLYVGPLEEDRWGHPGYRGAQKVMADCGVFLARVPGSWQPDERCESVTVGAPDAGAVTPAVWWEWPRTITMGEGAGEQRWLLRLARGLPPDVEVWVNGEFAIAGSLRSPPAWGASGVPFTIALRPGLIHAGGNAVTARGPRGGLSLEHLMDSGTLEHVSVRKLRVAADLGPLKANEEREWFVTPGSARVEESDLLPDTTILARDSVRGSVLLARRSNGLLWRGTEEVDPNDATTTAVFAAFLAMPGLPCSYPPSPQNVSCIVEEGTSGAVVVRLTGDPVEVNLGGNRARVSMDGLTLPWQRVGEDGRVVLPVPFGRAGSVFAFGRTELEVRPTGGPLTLEDLERDIRNPSVIEFSGKATGAGSLVVQVPFPFGWRASARVDDVAVIPRVGGATATLNLTAGTHTFDIRVDSPEVEEELSQSEGG